VTDPGPDWGPETCTRCGGPMPKGLTGLGRTRHINCEEAKAVWRELAEKRAKATTRKS
jgi:hypothetical protein